MVGWILWKEKEVCPLVAEPKMWPWPLTAKFWNSRVSGMGGLNNIEQKGYRSQSFMTMAVTVCWPKWSARIYRIMMTSSNGNIFHVTGHLWGEFTGHWWIPLTKVSDAGFDVFFHLRLNKHLSKQWRDWWFERPLYPLWRHCNVVTGITLDANVPSTLLVS